MELGLGVTKEQYKLLPNDCEDVCLSVNHTEILCGHCLPGYGTLVNGGGLRCHKCSSEDSQVKMRNITGFFTSSLSFSQYSFFS